MAEGWGAGAPALASIAALWLALAIDHWLGEPPARWHPVVWIGCYLGWAGRRIAPPAVADATRDLSRFAAGSVAWCAGAVLVMVVAWCLTAAFARHLPAWAGALLTGLALKPLLSWRMLRDEVAAVEGELSHSLDTGRMQLARLVSRDVSALSASEVRESAIESLSENLNDSLVAPVFWFVLFGLPGAAVYRFANTADAMWGYRGEREGRRWEWAGKWAARADDVLSWLPARLTALLLLCCSLFSGVRPGTCEVGSEAQKTPSPNSGWPMAAMALLLGVRLAKPGVYVLNLAGRPPVASDTLRAVALGNRVVALSALCATLALGSMATWGSR
ncbi:adenosylcobinamide-phosphate synthase CbiB [Variovorax sp. J22P240]|uniref:adenosylcobinamide-phosphate synthase CbiB n=1 Tax=Variovorax sp. J22P240 TaxID=3053514 RepID=UPI0025763C5E|nr:adenosylcobinamide-phosphate synthase CbiB [Variovorax sp. J22P240]MDL9998225.1 adenosylcobinamide-phosphate synthase CbiB [Variovorax sp. J22P240]